MDLVEQKGWQDPPIRCCGSGTDERGLLDCTFIFKIDDSLWLAFTQQHGDRQGTDRTFTRPPISATEFANMLTDAVEAWADTLPRFIPGRG